MFGWLVGDKSDKPDIGETRIIKIGGEYFPQVFCGGIDRGWQFIEDEIESTIFQSIGLRKGHETEQSAGKLLNAHMAKAWGHREVIWRSSKA